MLALHDAGSLMRTLGSLESQSPRAKALTEEEEANEGLGVLRVCLFRRRDSRAP